MTKPPAIADDMSGVPSGYGNTMVSTAGKGTIALNNNDSFVAGTNLGQGGGIGTTFLLSVLFVISQFLGFQELISKGYYFTGAQSTVTTSFLYVLSMLHLVHVLAGMIDHEPINIARNGSSNSAIHRSVLNWFTLNKKIVENKNNNIFVLINWAESCRLEAPLPHVWDSNQDTCADWADPTMQDYMQVNSMTDPHTVTTSEKEPFVTTQRFLVYSEIYTEILTAKDALSIQYFLQTQDNIRYLMTNSGIAFQNKKNYNSKTLFRKMLYTLQSSYTKNKSEKYNNAGINSTPNIHLQTFSSVRKVLSNVLYLLNK